MVVDTSYIVFFTFSMNTTPQGEQYHQDCVRGFWQSCVGQGVDGYIDMVKSKALGLFSGEKANILKQVDNLIAACAISSIAVLYEGSADRDMSFNEKMERVRDNFQKSGSVAGLETLMRDGLTAEPSENRILN